MKTFYQHAVRLLLLWVVVALQFWAWAPLSCTAAAADTGDTPASTANQDRNKPKKNTDADKSGISKPAAKPDEAEPKKKFRWPWSKDKKTDDNPKAIDVKKTTAKADSTKKDDGEKPSTHSRTSHRRSADADDNADNKKKPSSAKSDKTGVAKGANEKSKSTDTPKTARKSKSSGDTDGSEGRKKKTVKDEKTEVAKGTDEKAKKPDAKKTPDKTAEAKKGGDEKKEASKKDTPHRQADSAKSAKPEGNDKPAFRVPDSSVKDVTSSRGDRKPEPAEGEFEKHEAGEEKTAIKSHVATPVTSSEMQGWELMRVDGHDFVTSESLHRFYHFTQHEVSGSSVVLRSPVLVMKGNVGSQDLLINGIKFILSYPLEEANGKILFSRLDLCKLIDPVLRPSYISNAAPFDTVIVDAGHGGYDSGARGIYGYEKDYTLKLAFLLKADLERRGLKVVLTRKDDTFISLGDRVAIANQIPNSIFVALHFNYGPSTATGIETYALSPQGSSSIYGARSVDSLSFNGNQRDSENIALATAIHAMVVHRFRLVDRGVKRARWYVLTGLQRPGVLFEGGFVSNENDGRLIAAENFREELAATIGEAIMNYRKALQPAANGGR